MARVDVNTNTGPVTRQQGALNRAVNVTNGLMGRLTNLRGATAGGGGRGGFSGALSDFFTRDEFVGRSGTILKAMKGGHMLGAAMAFASVDEIGQRLLSYYKQEKSFGELVGETVKFLVPTILRETIPAAMNEELRRHQNNMKAEVMERMKQLQFDERYKNDSGFRREVVRRRQIRFHNSEEYRRQMQGVQNLRGGG